MKERDLDSGATGDRVVSETVLHGSRTLKMDRADGGSSVGEFKERSVSGSR
jgi:hypothetical protein